MIPYGRQDISQSDIDAVIDVLHSDWLTQGPITPKFESAISTYVRAENAIAVNSATSALHISYLALDLGPGDILWTSPNTFVATANAALFCGAAVDFVDIDPLTYNISIPRLVEKLDLAILENRLPKIVVAVHFAGQSCDMESIHALSKKYGFRIIEDASHAIGGKYAGHSVGGCQYSDITIFSFHPVKIITTGEGGMAITNDAKLAARMRLFRSHGVSPNKDLRASNPSDEIWNYQQISLGWNYRLTDIQSALGLAQLERVDRFVNRRHEIAQKYHEALEKMAVIPPYQDSKTYSSFHLYPVRIRESLCGKDRRQVYDAMISSGVGVNVHYIPVYLHPYYQKNGFERGLCPEAELYFKETISLPIFPAMTVEQQEVVISSLNTALR